MGQNTTMNFRISREDKEKFMKILSNQQKIATLVLVDFIKNYNEENKSALGEKTKK